jgi:hypothetical protein
MCQFRIFGFEVIVVVHIDVFVLAYAYVKVTDRAKSARGGERDDHAVLKCPSGSAAPARVRGALIFGPAAGEVTGFGVSPRVKLTAFFYSTFE